MPLIRSWIFQFSGPKLSPKQWKLFSIQRISWVDLGKQTKLDNYMSLLKIVIFLPPIKLLILVLVSKTFYNSTRYKEIKVFSSASVISQHISNCWSIYWNKSSNDDQIFLMCSCNLSQILLLDLQALAVCSWSEAKSPSVFFLHWQTKVSIPSAQQVSASVWCSSYASEAEPCPADITHTHRVKAGANEKYHLTFWQPWQTLLTPVWGNYLWVLFVFCWNFDFVV